ncbi:hypothetical protein K2173_023749 [Erythroxylum novogranatense]|uniref:non-specific serine/threonine protein kinase n=1 Tax=Erythroxylum novogranatense TaxID=1862640 RepID=A0AAV8TRG5_9ROSI|nr:hypothetical protein K2173_023749 [Erythroxylum novogranatense]
METKPRVLTQRYEVGRLIGQGTFAKVYYARSIRTNLSVAIKVIDKEKVFRARLVDQIKREISVMRMVRHPNIVLLYEVMATKSKIFFVMEYAKGGELFDKVAKGRLKEDIARKYFQQLINAVDFCHCRGVYHRDIKPENLLLDENENLKITDFGLSAFAESKHQDGLLHTTCGTPAYVAPEVVNRKGYDGAKADIWSCGVVLYVLLAGYLPFHDSNLMELYRKIGRAEYKCPNWFPTDVRRLLCKILDPNPNTRISMEKIRGSYWFRKGLNLNQSKPEIEADDAANHDRNGSGPSQSCSVASEPKQEQMKPPSLNAFDIISISAGFDLSGLFEDNSEMRETKFTSRQSASVIISKLEELGKQLSLKVIKKEAGLLRMEGLKEGRKGPLSIDAEIFEVTPALHLVELKKSEGDTLEYQKILKEDIRPALQDIVWVWQGEQEQPKETQERQQLEYVLQQQHLQQ